MLISPMPGQDDATARLPPGTLEMLVLRTLEVEPMHGYAIAQHIRRLARDAFPIEEGSLYPALQRMLVKGWVKAAWKTSTTGRRTRVYTLTAVGRKQLGLEQQKFSMTFDAIQRVLKGA